MRWERGKEEKEKKTKEREHCKRAVHMEKSRSSLLFLLNKIWVEVGPLLFFEEKKGKNIFHLYFLLFRPSHIP